MNLKKFSICVVAVWVTVLVSDFVIHQVLLKNMYGATANLWRPEAEMAQHMPAMFGGQFIVALCLAWIFVHGYKGTGIKEGVRFGLLIGGLEMGKNLIMAAVAPYPCSLVGSWIAAGFVQAILVGCVASLAYKK